MIAFNNENSPENKIIKNLEKLFDEISNLDSNVQHYDNVQTSDIKSILEDVLYSQNETEVNLLISKNPDNSLNLFLDILNE
jgi:flagellar hook-basal body complex protein FliE